MSFIANSVLDWKYDKKSAATFKGCVTKNAIFMFRKSNENAK